MKVNQLKMGSILSYAQMALSIIIGFVQAPILLRTLGQSEYGLYNTVASTLQMFSFLSLGFNASYVRYYAKYKKEGNVDAISRLNGLFLIIFSIIGLIALGCGLFLTFNLNLVFSEGLTASEYAIAKTLMSIMTISFTLTFPMSVFQSIISAHERFVFLKLAGMIKTVLSPIIVIPILLLGYKSIALATITVSISVFVDALYLIYVFFVLKQKFYFRNFEKGLFKSLFAFSSFIAINIIVDQINWNIDKVLLGRFKGTESVAIYTVGYLIYQYYMMFSTSISGVFTPRIHKIVQNTKEDLPRQKNEMTSLFIKVGRIQFIILSLIATGFIFFGQSFISFWAGEGYAESYYVALLLVVPTTVPLIQNIGIEVQRALNKHQFRSIAYTVMALLNIVLTIFLCQLYGATGATIGTAISMILANGIVMNIYYHKACNLDIILFWKNILRVSLGLILPIIAGVLMYIFIDVFVLWKLLVCIIIYTLIYCISMWFIGMNGYERGLIVKIINKKKGKNANAVDIRKDKV